jgi:AcrR family transcriptional regulator
LRQALWSPLPDFREREPAYREVHMPPTDAPLTRDRVLATAEDVIRRFGPAKATVVDVARALGVSHAAVYRHVATKAEPRDLVVGRWVEATMPPLRGSDVLESFLASLRREFT